MSLFTFNAIDATYDAREIMFTRQLPAGCSCIPSTRQLAADMEVRLTGWPNTPGCFTWMIDEAEPTGVVCRFFPAMTPNEVHAMHAAGGIIGGEFEDVLLNPNWGSDALMVLSDWMKEYGSAVSPVMQEFMAI